MDIKKEYERWLVNATADVVQKPMRFSKGETLFLPAGLDRCLAVGDVTVLKIRC